MREQRSESALRPRSDEDYDKKSIDKKRTAMFEWELERQKCFRSWQYVLVFAKMEEEARVASWKADVGPGGGPLRDSEQQRQADDSRSWGVWGAPGPCEV